MRNRVISVVALAFLVTAFAGILVPATAFAETLWYNGDPNGIAGMNNGMVQTSTEFFTYEDFNVSGTGWDINSVWSNNISINGSMANWQQAHWEIRSGVSQGNGGSVLYSGNSAATYTLTGWSYYGSDIYKTTVSGLNYHLDPGTYWLTVAPIAPTYGSGIYDATISYVAATSGSGSVGTPAGDNGNAYLYWPDNSIIFGLTTSWSSNYSDFSMGVATATAVPEPVSTTLFILGGATLAARRMRRRKG